MARRPVLSSTATATSLPSFISDAENQVCKNGCTLAETTSLSSSRINCAVAMTT